MKFFFFSCRKKREIHPHYSIRYLSFSFRAIPSILAPFLSLFFPFPDQMTENLFYFPSFFFFFSFNKIEARKIHHSERAIIIDKYVCRRPAPHSKNNYFNCDFPSPPSFASLVQTLSRFSKLVSSMCSVGGRGTQLTCLKTRGKPAG